jgi:membrane protein YdbS with pleckstrin-like domain
MEPLQEVPPIEDAAPAPAVVWQRLDPRVIQLQRTVGWIVFAVVMAVYTAFLGILWIAMWLKDDDMALWLPLTLSAPWPLIALLLVWLAHRFPELHYRYTTWRIDTIGLTIRTGVVWRKEISVARSRVQHIDVSQGPLERRYGLSTLSVYTAGTEHSEVDLDGLEHGVALAARDGLLPASDVDAV